ncbi:hypothetical protein GCM10028862_19120 [Luteimonas pelagia]
MRKTGLLVACCLLLAACGQRDAPALPPLPPPAPFDASTERVWQGRLPCADCAAIDMALRLGRDAEGAARYELQEAYHAADGGDRFVETGRWTFAEGVLLLEAEDGGARRFVLGEGGRLRPFPPRGDTWRDAGARDLQPVLPLP